MNENYKIQSVFDNNLDTLKQYYSSLKNLDEVLYKTDPRAEIMLFIDTLGIVLRDNKEIAEYAVKDLDKFCFFVKIILYYMETDHYELFGEPFCGRQFLKDSRDWRNDLKVLHLPIEASRMYKFTFSYPTSNYFIFDIKESSLLFEHFLSADKIRYFEDFIKNENITAESIELAMYPHMTYDYSDMKEYLVMYDVEEFRRRFKMIAEMRNMYTKEGISNLINNYSKEAMYVNTPDGEIIDLKNALHRTKNESIKSLL